MSLLRRNFSSTIILYIFANLLHNSLAVTILEGESVYSDVNSEVNLTCSAEGNIVFWKFEETTLAYLTGGTVSLARQNEEAYEASVNGKNFTLTIKNLKQGEAGKYYCDNNSKSDNVYVRVRERLNEIISSYATPHKSGKGKNIVLSFPEVEKIETNLTCSAFNVRPSPIISWGWKFAGRGDGRLKTIKTDRPETPQENTIRNFSSTLEIDEEILIELLNSKQNNTVEVTTILNQLDLEIVSTVINGNLTDDISLNSLALLQSEFRLSNTRIEIRCMASQLDKDIEEFFLLKLGSKYNSASQKRHNLYFILFLLFSFLKIFL